MADISINFNNALSSAVGSRGIKESWLKSSEKSVKAGLRSLQKKRGEGMTGWFDLPHEKTQVKKLLASARRKRGRFDDVVVLGIGGSALGTIALKSALLHPYHNLLGRSQRKGMPRLHVLDNVDPVYVARLFDDVLDIRKTLFIVITKSGSTAETMSQFLLAYDLVATCLGEKEVAKHIVAITDAEKGHLRPIAEDLGLETYAIPDGVGGRFSVLSPVGLVPAALCGMDVRGLLKGAARMDERCRSVSLYNNPAALYAAIHYLADVKLDARISVMMPYAQALKDLADWYCQLWAESLGKARDRAGKTVNVGPTPVKALGVTDQHSQVQLYTEGPYDKVLTLISVGKFATRLGIPKHFESVEGFGYLAGKDFNRLFESECQGTEIALTDAKRMNIGLHLPKVDANGLGQVFFLLECATAIAGELYDIDAFDQPGVEAGKKATYALMGRPGYEKQAEKIAKRKPGKKKFIL
jgi:glucose-6-phosphate isomerase